MGKYLDTLNQSPLHERATAAELEIAADNLEALDWARQKSSVQQFMALREARQQKTVNFGPLPYIDQVNSAYLESADTDPFYALRTHYAISSQLIDHMHFLGTGRELQRFATYEDVPPGYKERTIKAVAKVARKKRLTEIVDFVRTRVEIQPVRRVALEVDIAPSLLTTAAIELADQFEVLDDEIDTEAFDAEMTRQCQEVQQYKSPSPGLRQGDATAPLFTFLRQIYHMPDTPGFAERTLAQTMPYYHLGPYLEGSYYALPTIGAQPQHNPDAYEHVLEELAKLNAPLGKINRKISAKVNRQWQQQFPIQELLLADLVTAQEIQASLAISRLLMVSTCRQLVDAVAEGHILYSDILQYSDYAERKAFEPLPSPAKKEQPPIKVVDFPILQRGVGAPTGPRARSQPGERQRVTEQDHQDCLEELGKYVHWWDGELLSKPRNAPDEEKSYIVRSEIPGLPDDEQYYVAVLVETWPDGTRREHAVAYNPRKGDRHAIFALSADMGDWKEAFSLKKSELRTSDIKVRRITHNNPEHDREKVEEYLLRPASLQHINEPVWGARSVGRSAIQGILQT